MPILIVPALIELGVNAAIAGTVAGILWTGITIGLSLLFKPKVPKPEDGRIPMKQSIPSRIRIIGMRRTAGAFLLYYGSPGGTSYDVQAMCDGDVREFTRWYLHDDVVTLTGNVVDGLGGGRYGNGKIHIEWRTGLIPETAYSDAVSALSADDIWTNDHRGDGIASTYLRCADAGADEQSKRFPFGLPVLSTVPDATKVFDPRDVTHDWADPTTWTFGGNSNPVLQAVWITTAPIKDGGMGLDFEEVWLPVLTEIEAQADVCDELVALKAGGTEPRYRGHAMYYHSDDPLEPLSAILGSADIYLAERGDGAFTVRAGKWDDDDFDIVIEDRHIISIDVRRGKEDENDVTGVIVRYNSHIHEHVTIDAPAWPSTAYQGGEDRRVRAIDIVNCASGTQAQRLAKRVATYEMAEISGSMVLNLYGLLLLDRRGCTINCSDDLDLINVKARITRVQIDLVGGTVGVDFTVFDPVACDAWNAAIEEMPTQPVVVDLRPSALSTPTSVTATPNQVGDVVYVDIRFDHGVTASDNVGYDVRWRIHDIGGGVPSNWSVVTFSASTVDRTDPTFWIVTMNGMPSGSLDFQVQAFAHHHSSWSVTANADTTNFAPGRVTSLSSSYVAPDVVIDWISPDSDNFDHARVYRNSPSGVGFGTATDISGQVFGSPATAQTYTDSAPASGTYDYWVVSENVANVASAPRGPTTVTVP